ncbi:hypothetical protein LEN26_010144 [Aphanomyces euteiches]|nr:hypothetical protein LEN26_010144 [Aphanomyces euteiches]KAH9129811.1 hypothetical protein AeMF1_000159 [Aphanomyces euteiches]KAH9196414.1 hypothetical protein AeNC1_001600 [Aphanomyces euteiches]
MSKTKRNSNGDGELGVIKKAKKEVEPTPDKDGILRTYEDLVKLTQDHEQFDFFFRPGPGCISTASVKPSSKAQHKKIVAIDCEMCTTEHEVTKVRKSKSLVRVTMIDGEDPDDILIDLIVHQPEPGYNILRYKKEIHGIPEETIDNSKISEERARKEVLKYVGPDTIVVGHSVHGDLACIGIAHQRVIDTAFIFWRRNVEERQRTAGLRDLTRQLLAIDLPDVHDSFLDAKMSMLAANFALSNPIGPVIDHVRRNQTHHSAFEEIEEATHWLVHHIPKGLFSSDIEMFTATNTSIIPMLVDNIVFKETYGTTTVRFRTNEHARLAFDTIEAKTTQDALKRPTKIVNMTNSQGTKFSKIKITKVSTK